jgi:hypothetical protein
MACGLFKILLGNQPANASQLNSFETIAVQQEMDMRWVAQLEIPLRTDAQGRWTGESEAWLQPMQRLRIEVNQQGKGFTPLIDGTIVSLHHDLHMEPGQSTLRLEVHDDGYLLHRDESVKLFRGMTDDQIAAQIFEFNNQVIKSTEIQRTDPPQNLSDTTTVLRGTPMSLLQQLANRQIDAWHAFILPGPDRQSSVGCFKKDPTGDSGLPPMVLTGEGRNLMNIRFSYDSSAPAIYRGGAVSLNDASVDSRIAAVPIRPPGTDPPAGEPSHRMLRPGQSRNVNLQNAVQSSTEQAAFGYHAEGEVLKDTYDAILQPYKNVKVLGANGRLSGLWMIRQVTHTLTRNSYGQTFSLQRDAQSLGTGSAAPAPSKLVHS